MTAFVGSATASLFPSCNFVGQQESIDSEFEEAGMSSRAPVAEPSVQYNSYGRPTAAILPTPKTSMQQPKEIVRPILTYPPNFLQESSDFHQAQTANTNTSLTSLPTHELVGIKSQTTFIPEKLQYPITNDKKW